MDGNEECVGEVGLHCPSKMDDLPVSSQAVELADPAAWQVPDVLNAQKYRSIPLLGDGYAGEAVQWWLLSFPLPHSPCLVDPRPLPQVTLTTTTLSSNVGNCESTK